MPRKIIPMAHRQPCPKCERDTLEIGMLNAMAGRTGFITQSCKECGYIQTSSMTLPRPIWHWILAASTVIAISVGILFLTFHF